MLVSCFSRVMSPEVDALPPHHHHHHHQRTQSMDSTSSGHSSGSGSGSGSGSSGFNGRRRVTVKPLAEPEDHDTPSFIRSVAALLHSHSSDGQTVH